MRPSLALSSLRLLRPAARGHWRFGISALDQIGLSLFSFGLNLVLVRVLSTTDYGIVALWLAVALLATTVQSALVSAPLNIHMPALADPTAARRLDRSVGVVNLILVGLTGVAALAVIFLSDAEWAPRGAAAVLAIPAFLAMGLYREYFRSVAFGRGDMAMLVWADGPYVLVTSLCLAAMLAWPERFAALAAPFLAMACGGLVSQLYLRGRLGLGMPNPFAFGWWREYRRVSRDIGWALIGVLSTHLQVRSYVYVTANMVSLTALAAINIVGVLYRPVGMMISAWGRGALPVMAAHLAAGRIRAFDRMVLSSVVAAVAGLVVWFALLSVAWEPIERHFLAGRYPDAWELMLPWAVAAALSTVEYALGIALQAARDFKFLAVASLISGPVTIGGAVGSILLYDYTWTMYGVALGTLVALVLKGGRILQLRRRTSAVVPVIPG